MTRLEQLIEKIDEAYEREGDFFFDPIPFIRDYIAERDRILGDELKDASKQRSQEFKDIVEANLWYISQRGPQFDNEQV